MNVPPHLVSVIGSHLALVKLALSQQYKLAPHQLVALGLLASRGPMRFKDLRSRLSLPKSSFTFLVDGLEKRGLVERTREDDDRRQWTVALTSNGLDFADDVGKKEAAILEPVLAPLSETESSALATFANQLPEGFPSGFPGKKRRKKG